MCGLLVWVDTSSQELAAVFLLLEDRCGWRSAMASIQWPFLGVGKFTEPSSPIDDPDGTSASLACKKSLNGCDVSLSTWRVTPYIPFFRTNIHLSLVVYSIAKSWDCLLAKRRPQANVHLEACIHKMGLLGYESECDTRASNAERCPLQNVLRTFLTLLGSI